MTARAPYVGYFGLRESPFSNTPDNRFVYLGQRHKKALAHLLRGLQAQGGIVHLTGDIGIGKTTLCRLLLDRLPDDVHAALISDPTLTPTVLVDTLHANLQAARAAGRRTVLIVDEAQNLGGGALEQVRLLASLETGAQKLLEIILIGQPRLIDLLGVEVLPRLSPGSTAGYHLLPFDEDDTFTYVSHRLTQAGRGRDLFEIGALREVYRLSGGVPRLINAICDRALLGAHAQRRQTVDSLTVRAAAHEPLVEAGLPAFDRAPVGQAPPPASTTQARRPLWPWLVGAGLVVNALVIGSTLVVTRPSGRAVVEPPAAVVEETAPVPRVEPPIAPAPAAERRATAPESLPATELPAPTHVEVPPTTSGEPTTAPKQLESRESGFKIDILVWAPDPKERMVYVKGRKYVEGEALESGTIIEEIVEDGLVLAHDGQRTMIPSDPMRELRR